MRIWIRTSVLAPLAVVALLVGACDDGGGGGETESDTVELDAEDSDAPGELGDASVDEGMQDDGGGVPDAVGEDIPEELGPFPSGLPPTEMLGEPHGFGIARAIIHAHTIFSHDACDGKPVDADGNPNEECLGSFRAAICTDNIDFAMMTEHTGTMAETLDFDLLFLQREGDTWFDEDGVHSANVVHCGDGHDSMIMPGLEADHGVASPVGLTGHPVTGTIEEIQAGYNDPSPEGIQRIRDQHGVPTAIHIEGWDVNELYQLDLDAFEIGNLHTLIAPNYREELGLEVATPIEAFSGYFFQPDEHPAPDLVFLEFHEKVGVYLDLWDGMLQERMVAGFAGNDVHQNVFPMALADGDRPDSYRRMMKWYVNHLLVTEKTPAQAREAVSTGRMYIVFEVLGSPVGFDFWAEDGETTWLMGEVAESGGDASSVHLHATIPGAIVTGAEQSPPVTIRLYRITEAGTELAYETNEELDLPAPGAGRYRVELEVMPTHLAGWLEGYEQLLHPFPWIYSNPIEVR